MYACHTYIMRMIKAFKLASVKKIAICSRGCAASF